MQFARGADDGACGNADATADQRAGGQQAGQEGTPVQFTVIQDVTLGGVLAIPRGATVHGVVTEVKRTESGDLARQLRTGAAAHFA